MRILYRFHFSAKNLSRVKKNERTPGKNMIYHTEIKVPLCIAYVLEKHPQE